MKSFTLKVLAAIAFISTSDIFANRHLMPIPSSIAISYPDAGWDIGQVDISVHLSGGRIDKLTVIVNGANYAYPQKYLKASDRYIPGSFKLLTTRYTTSNKPNDEFVDIILRYKEEDEDRVQLDRSVVLRNGKFQPPPQH